jgi:hypothetical protein
LLSVPRVTEMFQFTRFPLRPYLIQTGVTGHDPSRVSPFGDPRIKAWSTAPRGLSQPPTSFIGIWRQGIHRWLFIAWEFLLALFPYKVLLLHDLVQMLVLALEFSKDGVRPAARARHEVGRVAADGLESHRARRGARAAPSQRNSDAGTVTRGSRWCPDGPALSVRALADPGVGMPTSGDWPVIDVGAPNRSSRRRKGRAVRSLERR